MQNASRKVEIHNILPPTPPPEPINMIQHDRTAELRLKAQVDDLTIKLSLAEKEIKE